MFQNTLNQPERGEGARKEQN